MGEPECREVCFTGRLWRPCPRSPSEETKAALSSPPNLLQEPEEKRIVQELLETEQAYVARLHLLDQASGWAAPTRAPAPVCSPDPCSAPIPTSPELRVRTPQFDSGKPESSNPAGYSWGRNLEQPLSSTPHSNRGARASPAQRTHQPGLPGPTQCPHLPSQSKRPQHYHPFTLP